MQIENATEVESKIDVASEVAQDIASIVTPEDSEILAIKDKYEGDPVKMAKAYKDLQSKHSKLANDTVVPNEYKFPEKVPEDVKQRLIDAGKVLKMTQPQFDYYVSNFTKAQKEIADKRLEAAGGEEGMQKIKAFFEGKMPKAALENILKNGDIDAIKELKKMRDDKFSGETDKVGSPDMTSNTNDNDESFLAREINKKNKEHIDLIFKRTSPTFNASDIEELDEQIKSKAREIAAMKKKIKMGRAESLEFF